MTTNTNNFPDFSHYQYQIKRELGHNRAGGRVTYLAVHLPTQKFVVIKQFQFAQTGSSWSEYAAYEQEITLLRQLNHPGIPRYLNSFETPTGFCLVQEYKQAPSLAVQELWTVAEIKQIAVSILEILIYLQQQAPPVIHRDIKPENILVNRRQGRLQAYLVDFGLARVGSGEVSVSSVVKGTLGFMPPEQMFNRELTMASDLYSLGATLICLLTRTKSTDVGKLIDEQYRLHVRHLVPQMNFVFVLWLEQMVAPNPKNRYANATVALEKLNAIALYQTFKRTRSPKDEVIVLLIFLGFTLAIHGESLLRYIGIHQYLFPSIDSKTQKQIDQLLDTKKCPGCDLRFANLDGVDLSGADLSKAKLNQARLNQANLTGANLNEADLSGAWLVGANLTNANLQKVNMGLNIGQFAEDGGVQNGGAYSQQCANLQNANLTNADLRNSILFCPFFRGTNFTRANLTNIRIEKSTMMEANLSQANLNGSVFVNVTLKKANLSRVVLKFARFIKVDLAYANLQNADLSGISLVKGQLGSANLQSANLRQANLTQAYISHANLSSANLTEANMTKSTLQYTNLSEAYLDRANLSEANLVCALIANTKLNKTNFSQAILSEAQVKNADFRTTILSGARMPDDSLYPAENPPKNNSELLAKLTSKVRCN